MLRKSLLSFLFITSLACFGQVATTGGYATTAGPAVVPVSAANAPLVATPHVALPGSGPAVGAPISNENDSRVSAGPSVANPNGLAPLAIENAANASAAGTNVEATAPAATGTGMAAGTNAATANPTTSAPFEFGVQRFGSPSPGPRSPVTSLGEIARYYRTHHRQAVRTFNNASIAQLTTTGLPFAPLSSTPVVAASASSTGTLMAQNQPPALPQNDQDNAPLRSDRASQSSTEFQQRHATIQNAAATDEKQAAVTNANSGSSSSPKSPSSATTPAKLPQTSSSLPLLLVLGGAGLVGGTLWLLRR